MSNAELVFVDLSSIAHPIYHISGDNPDPNHVSTAIVARVRSLTAAYPHAAICCDTGRSFRKDISADYKANRPPSEPALHHQIDLAKEILVADGYPVWAVPGFEADDLIATATRRALETGGMDVLVISSDKDLTQLVGPRVRQKRLVRVKVDGVEMDEPILDVAAVIAKSGVRPDQMGDYLAICGDTSDNIVGCKGIGPKGAAELLAKWGTLDALYLKAVEIGPQAMGLKPAQAASLKEFQTRYSVVRALIALRTDVDIQFETIAAERVAKDAATFGADQIGWEGDAPDYGDEDDAREREERGGFDVPPPLVPMQDGGAVYQGGMGAPAKPMAAVPPATESMMAAGERVVDALREEAACQTAKSGTNETSSTFGKQPSLDAATLQSKTPESAPKDVATSGNAPNVSEHGLSKSETSTALAVRQVDATPVRPGWELAPRNLSQARALAIDMFASRQFLAAYGHPAAVMGCIMTGQEIGLPPMAALRVLSAHVIKGKQTFPADLLRALVIKSGKAKYFRVVERTNTSCTFETQRADGDDPPVTLTFTIEDGKAAWDKGAEAWANSGYVKNPADQLVARASSKLCRLVYPDVTTGMYSSEEME